MSADDRVGSGREAILAWYEPRRRLYPWRVRPSPYRVLVSEVMLQQTQAARVVGPYRLFLRRFPSVTSLARAPRSEVIRAWAGLGYNRRAGALHESARIIVKGHAGRVPARPDELVALPGVGPYTAGAVASIAYGARLAAVDTNVGRVVARARLGREPHEARRGAVAAAAAAWLDADDPGSWNQALMDLGREVCRPFPRCGACPLAGACAFRHSGRQARPRGRKQPAFEGSFRQVRGLVISKLRENGSATVGSLSRGTGQPAERVARAVRALAADDLVRAGPAALAGRSRGRVALPD